jgi:hypothetical protein
MNRNSTFSEAVAVPVQIKDARFGLRKMPTSKNEQPSIFSYSSPGMGVNGEHQS